MSRSTSAVVGFDFSTVAVHAVILDGGRGGRADTATVPLVGADAFERTRDVARAMRELEKIIPWQRTIAVGIEEPQGIAKSTVGKLKAVQGAICVCIPSGLLVQPYVPAQWRKLAGIAGGADKTAVLEWAQANGSPAPPAAKWAQDTADAFCIARALLSELAIDAT